MRGALILAGAALAALTGVSVPSLARAGVPAATFGTQCVDGNPVEYAGGPGVALCQVDGGQASVQEGPWAQVQAQVYDNGVFTQHLDATLNYFFQVTGGTSGDLVPVDISANLITSGAAGGEGSAFISVSGSQGTAQELVCNYSLCNDLEFHGVLQLMVPIGENEQVTLQVAAGGYQFDAQALATADPLIYVDPGFAGHDGLGIELSPGVANALPTSGAPEPAAWALALAGFSLAGAELRRRLPARG